MRTFFYLLASLLASIALGSLATYVAVETLPCHWFGTGFEGACAYGALFASACIGLTVLVLTFSYLCYRMIKKNRATQNK